jgi:hypothetical protein
MNQIKDYYIKHNKEIEPAFKWRLKSLPPTDKPYSIANLMAIEVALLGAVTGVASMYFLLIALERWWGWGALVAMFVFTYIVLWVLYKRLLVDNQ